MQQVRARHMERNSLAQDCTAQMCCVQHRLVHDALHRQAVICSRVAPGKRGSGVVVGAAVARCARRLDPGTRGRSNTQKRVETNQKQYCNQKKYLRLELYPRLGAAPRPRTREQTAGFNMASPEVDWDRCDRWTSLQRGRCRSRPNFSCMRAALRCAAPPTCVKRQLHEPTWPLPGFPS